MNDAQIWTIIVALYVFSAGGYLAVRKVDRIFARFDTRPRDRSGDPPSGAGSTDG